MTRVRTRDEQNEPNHIDEDVACRASACAPFLDYIHFACELQQV